MNSAPTEDGSDPGQTARALRHRIPLRLWQSLDNDQRALLLDAFKVQQTRHYLDYRVSINTLFWGRYYLTVFAGPERRNKQRLAAEGQTALSRQAGLFVGIGLLVTTYAIFGVITFAYLLKSALGIDLTDDASIFHPLYEWFYGR